jgi:hypothetical protein
MTGTAGGGRVDDREQIEIGIEHEGGGREREKVIYTQYTLIYPIYIYRDTYINRLPILPITLALTQRGHVYWHGPRLPGFAHYRTPFHCPLQTPIPNAAWGMTNETSRGRQTNIPWRWRRFVLAAGCLSVVVITVSGDD